MAPGPAAQPAADHLVGAQPLTEDHHLGRRVVKPLVQQGQQFVGLVPVVGFVVEQEGAVAGHAHVLERALQPALVDVGQVAGLAPARHDARDDGAVFVVVHTLLRRQGHEEAAVHTLGQLRQHLGLAPAQHHRRQGLLDLIQRAVADDAAGVVAQLVFIQHPPGGAQPVLVDELHDGDQLFETVLQRRARQHQRIRAGDALERTRRHRVPVLDALRLVGDDEFRRPGVDEVGVARQHFVVDDAAEGVFGVLHLALWAQAMDDLRRPVGEARELGFPLVLQRGGAHHQHALHAEVARHQLGRGDGLHRLAQAHLIAQQGAAGTRGEQRAFGLVGVQAGLQQLVQRLVMNAFGVGLRQGLLALFGVAHLGNEGPDIVAHPQFVAGCLRRLGQHADVVQAVPRQRPAGRRIEAQPCLLQHLRRASGAGVQTQLTGAQVVQSDLAVRWRMATRQRRLAAAARLQPRQREFDVLAGTQVVGGVVPAGALVVPGRQTADGDEVMRAAVGVVDAERGEHRLRAKVAQGKGLFAPELAAQGGLPVGHRKGLRPPCARQSGLAGRLGQRCGLGFAQRGGGHGGADMAVGTALLPQSRC